MRDVLAELAQILESTGVRYALIGGHAVNAWLEPRFTSDVDITVEAGVAEMNRLRQALASAGYAVEDQHGSELASGPDFVRIVSQDGEVVLELQAAKTALQEEVLSRAQRDGRGLRIATPEDLIVLKLIANRRKDQVDLLGLCALEGLDWPYIEHWVEDWDLAAALAAVRP